MSSGVNANVDIGGMLDWATGVSSARSYEYTRRLQKHAMNFQREMSNTAHQREVADLKAAGLNPILSANGGADGGSVGGGDVSGGQPGQMSMDPVSAYATLKQIDNQTKETESKVIANTAQATKDLAEAENKDINTIAQDMANKQNAQNDTTKDTGHWERFLQSMTRRIMGTNVAHAGAPTSAKTYKTRSGGTYKY